MKSVLYFLILTPIVIIAQTIEPSKAVEKNILELETEVFYAKDKNDWVTKATRNSTSLLIRYGVIEGFELNVSVAHSKEQEFENLINNNVLSSLLKVGFVKSIPLNSKQFSLSLLANSLVYLDKNEQNNLDVGFSVGFSSTYEFNNNWSLNTHIIYIKDFNNTDRYNYTINLCYALNNRWSIFTEHTAEYCKKMDWTQSLGLGYCKNDWTFELNVGSGFNMPTYFIGGRIIKEFNFKKAVSQQDSIQYVDRF